MLIMPKETLYPATSQGQREGRLAVRLAAMIPGAVAVRVSLADPRHQWPHPYTVALDARGEQLPLGWTTAKVAARWVLRTWPEADWMRPHTFDLATGQLVAGNSTPVRGR